MKIRINMSQATKNKIQTEKRLNVKVPIELYEEFKGVVALRGCQISYEVRNMMKKYIKEYKNAK